MLIACVFLSIVGVICLIYWHKKIDSKTTWIYGIYIVIQLILWLFVGLKLELH